MTPESAPRDYRGSRKHVLDWVQSEQFVVELTELLGPVSLDIGEPAIYRPQGYTDPAELRLDVRDSGFAVLAPIREDLQRWWLVHTRGANTPNWDLAVACDIENRPGLVLVEAKANYPELKAEGKLSSGDASTNSRENHEQIERAIDQARNGLADAGIETSISIDSHYQLANRVAFMWKLAMLGVPTVLLYLGFTGDEGIRDAGPPFENDSDWQRAFADYSRGILPEGMLERRLEVSGVPAWLLVRSRPVLEQSPSAGSRSAGF